jgi:carbonic anhydrase
MSDINGALKSLHDGYDRFRAGSYATQASRFRSLAGGQSPKVMVIACADSRVDPAMIFDAAPGELFVVRNVANLVPPFEEDGTFHGTSAAIEFAVQFLKVEAIVVMGHADCGGIRACFARERGERIGRFIDPWVALADRARQQVLETVPEGEEDEKVLRRIEHETVRLSLANLMTFPFVAAAVENGLSLRGSWFSVASGELHWLDDATGSFHPLREG